MTALRRRLLRPLTVKGPRLRRATRASCVWVLTPLLIFAFAWRPVDLVPRAGSDHSWVGALQIAAHNGLSFGTQVVFTYGPLGFLANPQLWYAHLGEMSFAYLLLIRFGLVLALFAGAKRAFGVLTSALLAFSIASAVGFVTYPAEAVAFFIVAVGAILQKADAGRSIAIALAAGAFTGIEVLVKLSVGIWLMVLTAIFACTLSGRRRNYLLAAMTGFVLTLLLGWSVSGHGLGALPSYVRNGAQILIGYGPAMSIEQPGLGWEYVVVPFAVALGVWGILQMTRLHQPRQRWGIALLWVVLAFFLFKEGFVRHDSGHAVVCLGGLLGGFMAFRWSPDYRPFGLAGIAAMFIMLLAAQSSIPGQPQSLVEPFNPLSNMGFLASELHGITSELKRAQLIREGRAAIQAADRVDSRSLALLQGRTVSVYPTEIAIIWAYGLTWHPLPVLQSYSAYTPTLDEVDADALTSRRAPERILYVAGGSIDGRVLSFDEGITSRSLLCRYRTMRATQTLVVLGHSLNRCAAVRRLSVVHADWGQAVSVPRPRARMLVYVRIDGVNPRGLESVRSLLFRPHTREVVLDGAPHRLVSANAIDGLPLRAAPGVDFPGPAKLAPDAATIAVAKDGQGRTGRRPITFSFYSEFISPSGKP